MATTDDLVPLLKKLRLSGVLQTLDLRTREALDDSLSHVEFLLRLCADEVERRESKQLELRLRRANFDRPKSLEDFEWAFNPTVPKSRIVDLATCGFIPRRENALLVGPTGVGKSHIAQAIGERACRAGHSVCYVSAHDMLGQLRSARADGSLERRMLRFTSPDLLIVDDLGLRPLERDEPIDLYEVIRERYERGSMIITSNRDVSEWYPMFPDELMASAAMDRLLHHAHVLELTGNPYRNPPASKAAVSDQSDGTAWPGWVGPLGRPRGGIEWALLDTPTAPIASASNRPQKETRRYVARPAHPQGRLEVRGDGKVKWTLRKPWRDGTRAFVFEPL